VSEDDALIAQHLQGNADAFEVLFDRYAARLVGFLTGLGAERDLAEDLAQKCWMRVIANLAQYEPRGTFRSWLFTLAHRVWLDERRSGWDRRRVALPEGAEDGSGLPGGAPAAPQANPREQAARRQESELLAEALGQLPEEMRQTVLLRTDGELTFREIAEEMHCPLGTVLWRMQEAQRRLRSLLAGPEPNCGVRECLPETGGNR
jgi:RNA polymerase sigma-70 factor (ECF subfamily)